MPECNGCLLSYLITGAVSVAVLVAGLLPLLFLRSKKTAAGGNGDASINHEMVPVPNEDEVLYREIAFTNNKKKPRDTNAEEDVTYSEIKNSRNPELKKAEGKRPDKPSNSADTPTLYAEINPRSHQPVPQEGSTDLYACVNKKK